MFFLLLMMLAGGAWAYESDQLTGRDQPPADALVAANAELNRMLSVAVENLNGKTNCVGTDEAMRVALAREIFEVVGINTTIPARGKLPPMVEGAYGAWLETGAIERRTFADREDIYGGVTFWENAILDRFGPASTIRLGNVLLGTDKIDHFWVQGYLYFKVSRWGQDPERAIRWGTRTERTIWGLGSTQIFSFGDLAANYDGFTLYNELLSPESEFHRRPDGCVEQSRPFDWSEWVDWEYDEVLNPSVYESDVHRALEAHLRANRDRVCAEYQAWSRQGIHPRPPTMDLSQRPAYIVGEAPQQTDPFNLERLCRP